jgi:uncharacterized protein
VSSGELEAALVSILRARGWLWKALHIVRAVDPPDWVITAGVIRDAVWDHLHGYSESAPPRDVDVGFFDRDDLGSERESALDAELRRHAPDFPWESRNHAAAHHWLESVSGAAVDPPRSVADAVALWPETATCVGVRLEADAELMVIAPFGLDDLFGMILRPNPVHADAALFERRIREKRFVERWPQVTLDW